jgi:hypothetical protein
MRTNKLKLSMIAVFLALAFLSMPGMFLAPSAQGMPTGATTTNVGAPMLSAISATTSVQSINWGGYAVTGSGFTAVSGSWTQPSVTCPSTGTAYVSIWVGIDGFKSNTVEQTGTTAQCSSGKAAYWAWYEFYPAFSVKIPMTVKAGNKFTAQVAYSTVTKKFTTTITDTSTGKTFSISKALSSAKRSSAEWIVERPAVCSGGSCSLTTLADFHTATFTSASATLGTTTGSISTFTNYAITMVKSKTGPTLAKPSALGSGGTSFTMTYV